MYFGFKAVGEAVTELEGGKQYLFFDATTASGRSGFINVSDNNVVLTNNATEGSPSYVWTLEATSGDNQFKVMNSNKKYIPSLPNGQNVTVSDNGDTFTFTLNSDNETWKIKGTNGSYWNGNVGSMTGWSDAHPYKVYTFVPVPYFEVKCNYVDDSGNAISSISATVTIVKAGDSYTLNAPELEGYEKPTVNVSAEQLAAVSANLDIQVVYKPVSTGIDSVESATEADSGLYDLNGRKLDKATVKGIYIENGQKVVK